MKRIWVLLLAAALLLTGCAKDADVALTLSCMDSTMQLQLWGEESETAAQQVQELLLALESEWSVTSPESVIPALQLYGVEVEVPEYWEDPETGVVSEVPGTGAAYEFTVRQLEVIEKALAMSLRTDGAFDPQLGALIQLWGFTSGGYHVPTPEAAEDAAQLSDWDLSTAIKGYAGDRAVELLQQMNVDCAILDLGGNVQTYGTKAGGKPWSIGIRDPKNESNTVCTVEVKGTVSVATSATYQRYFEQNGQLYHDILDPQTGYPVRNELASVTVICNDGMTADCLSTALHVMGHEEAVKHWQESDDFEMVLVHEDGTVFATEGVSLSGSCKTISREN